MLTHGLHSSSFSCPILYHCMYLFFSTFSMFFVVSHLKMDGTCTFVLKQSSKKMFQNISLQFLWFLDTFSFSFALVCLFYSACLVCSLIILSDSFKLMFSHNKSMLYTAVSPSEINVQDWDHVEESLLCLFHISLDLPRINGLCVSQQVADKSPSSYPKFLQGFLLPSGPLTTFPVFDSKTMTL